MMLLCHVSYNSTNSFSQGDAYEVAWFKEIEHTSATVLLSISPTVS